MIQCKKVLIVEDNFDIRETLAEALSEERIVTISAVDATRSIEDPTPLITHGRLSKPFSWDQMWHEVQKHCGTSLADAA